MGFIISQQPTEMRKETYFAAGDYEPWEERVAGSPEYAFNEYLQAAVELGIPLAVCLLVVVVLCLYRGSP